MDDSANARPERPWHAVAADEVARESGSGEAGLDTAEARRRAEQYGPNRLTPAARRGPLVRFLLQFHNILIYVLIAAGIGTAFLQHWIDTGVIFAVVIINAIIGFIQEGKAERALEAISRMLSLEATVVRDGKRQSIPAEEVVPGDRVVLRTGDKVPADLRLVQSRELRIDEAMLTGESVPAEKGTAAVPADTPLGDRSCMAFSGTLVTSGQAAGIVTAIGDDTELGKISSLVSETESVTTPLISQVNRFGHIIAVVVLVVAALTFAVGYAVGQGEPVELFLAAVALAVAAIPEGLPAIMTIVLAIGVQNMAHRNAIIRRLPAVDTLGALNVICSDKTGTLTRNEMTVTRIATAHGTFAVTGVGYAPDGSIERDGEAVDPGREAALQALLHAGTLCNDSELEQGEGGWRASGDPMEGALLTAALKGGIDVDALRRGRPPVDTIPFESANRFMATLHGPGAGGGGAPTIYVKGAPERILEMCAQQMGPGGEAEDLDHQAWEERATDMASRGQRVLAFAVREADGDQEELRADHVREGLVLVGLAGIVDPPRREVIEAVGNCQDAGIRVVMITGDHAVTARAIGEKLRIGDGKTVMTGADLDSLDDDELRDAARDCDVFARVSPEHKLRLVTAIQSHGLVAAMTGDGVNDAPALKRADVGIAMGIKGTEVTKEAAEMVLADDNFASIAHAVEEGRTVYDNLRKAILFILPTNGGEALTVFLAILLGRTLPLTPVQVLWVNMITAVTLALALAFERPEADVMKRPPRDPDTQLLTPYFVWRIALVSALMCAGAFGTFVWMRDQGASLEVARTVAVNAIVLFEAFYLLNTRFILAPVLNARGLFGNRLVLLAIALVIGFQVLFTYLPLMQGLFGTAAIGLAEWGVLVIVASSVLWVVELEKWFARRLGITP